MKAPSQFKLTIPSPCTQNWDNMSSSCQGRFCTSCNKQVTDFTKFTNKEILKYFAKSKGPICGRLTQAQMEINFGRLEHPIRKSLLPKFLMSAILTTSGVCNTEAKNSSTTIQIEMENNSNTKPIKNIKFLPTTDTTQYILGRVLDNENIPLESANITLKGNKIGTSSDREGKFKIMVPDSVLGKKIVLIVSYAGFETQEINISTKSFPIDIAVNLKVGAFLGEVTINKKPSLWERIFMKK